MYSSAENGSWAEASSRITLSRVRITVWRRDSGSSAGVTVCCRSATSTVFRSVLASASIRGVSPRRRMSRPRWPGLFERSVIRVSMSRSRTISPETACDALTTAPMSAARRGRQTGRWQSAGWGPRGAPDESARAAGPCPGRPAEITVPCVPQIGVRDGLEAASRVEPCGELVGDALILDEAEFSRHPDGRFIEGSASRSRPSRRAISAATRAAGFPKFSDSSSAHRARVLVVHGTSASRCSGRSSAGAEA